MRTDPARVHRQIVAAFLCLGMAGACAANAPGVDRLPPEPGRVVVAPHRVTVRFPVPTTRCAFLRSTDASRIYVWILYVGEGNPRHTVEVAAAVPDSLAARDSSLSALSPYLTADVARIGGEPLMKLGTVRTTARAWVEGDTSIVVRVTEWAAIHRVFASRPGTAGMHVCGEESIRRVRVRYEPGF